MTITDAVHQAVLKVQAIAWTAAIEPGGEIRGGARVAEIAGDCLKGWPKGMRLIVRKERSRPGVQLRITDADGLRLTCFANTADMPIAALELRHRRRARAEDRIRAARATGLRNLPLRDTAQNRKRLEIVQIALDLLAWMPMLALTGETRRWEPRRLRIRPFSAAAQLVTTARRRYLICARHWPWTDVITEAIIWLEALPTPADQYVPAPASSTPRPELWNPAPTRRDSRAISLPTSPDNRNGQPKKPTDRHERSRRREAMASRAVRPGGRGMRRFGTSLRTTGRGRQEGARVRCGSLGRERWGRGHGAAAPRVRARQEIPFAGHVMKVPGPGTRTGPGVRDNERSARAG